MLPKKLFRLRRTTVLTLLSLAVLGGIGLSRFDWVLPWQLLPLVAVIWVIAARQKWWLGVVGAIVFGLVLGLIRGGAIMQQLAPYKSLYGHKIVLRVVANEDAVYGVNTQLTFDAVNVEVIEPLSQRLPGKLKIAGFGENMVYHGDVVQVEGKLYATRGGRVGGVSYATLAIRGHHGTVVDTIRRNFSAGMQNALPEPLASFGLGLLIGQRSGLPDQTAKQLAAVGLTHIIAVSGYNLTIIVEMVRRLTRKGSKYQSVLLSAALVGAFLLMTGFSASIVRASIVSMLSIAAWYYGRRFKPVLLISLTAAVTALWSPLYLWSDIGWYLSFFAFFGVLVVAPLAMQRIYKRREPGLVGAILLETMCAQLMTLPLILYIFQQISLVSLLSNLVVVPLVPAAMLLALIAGMAGMLSPAIAGWFAWPARLVLTYMLDITSLLARVPHALSHYALSLPWLLYVYGLILGLVTTSHHKLKPRRGIITDIKSTM